MWGANGRKGGSGFTVRVFGHGPVKIEVAGLDRFITTVRGSRMGSGTRCIWAPAVAIVRACRGRQS